MMKRTEKGVPFEITFSTNGWTKGDILLSVDRLELVVVKTYPFNWWRRLLYRLGFPYHSMDCVKIKQIIKE